VKNIMKKLFANSFEKVERKSLADLSSEKSIDKSKSEKIEGGCFVCSFFEFHMFSWESAHGGKRELPMA
jgi:hypothetical protein